MTRRLRTCESGYAPRQAASPVACSMVQQDGGADAREVLAPGLGGPLSGGTCQGRAEH